MSSATLSRIETGRQELTVGTLFHICQALGVDAGYFFGPNHVDAEHVSLALNQVREARKEFETAANRARSLERSLVALVAKLRNKNEKRSSQTTGKSAPR